MKTLTRYSIVIFLIIASAIGGVMWGKKMEIFKTHEKESSHVMLEKVAKVFKLVAVEAHVSEIYNYKQYKYWDIDLLRKQALVRVKAKVSIGYDFEELEFLVDEKEGVVSLIGFPDPKILSVDHELDYYDMNEGLFNSFDGEELTDISQKAKDYTVSLIEKGDLFKQAEEQKDELLKMLKDIFALSGWEMQIKDVEEVLRG